MVNSDWSARGKSRVIKKNREQEELEENGRGNSSAKANGRRRSQGSKGLTILSLLVVILLIGGVYLGFKYTDRLLAVDDPSLLDGDKELAVVETGPKKRDVLTFLLIGTDQRGREAARSDTLILAMLDKKEKHLYLFSIPRDTRAQIPGRGVEKINHAYAYGGAALAVEAVENLLDIKTNGHISTNFVGFANIIDLIGGVEHTVERRMFYPDEGINLQPGKQRLNGADALAYVRFRSDARGDLGRMERQQKFLMVTADQLLSAGNIIKIPSLVKEVNNNVKTDITVRDMVSLANLLRTVKAENITSQTMPGEAVWIREGSYYVLDEKATRQLLDPIIYVEEEQENAEKAPKDS